VNAIRESTGCEFRMIAGLPLFSHEELVPLYDADLFAADHAVGELLRRLAGAGVLEDALVVLTSDHGELLGESGRFSHQLYVDEPLMHVPLILKLPRGERAGTIVDDPLVSNLDVYATVLAAAGVEEASESLSRDLVAVSRQPPRALFVGEYEPSRAYLDYLHGLNDRFDVEAHLRERFVVYTPEFRTELVGRTAVATTPLSGRTAVTAEGATGEARLAAAAREAEKALATYLAAKDVARGGKARFTGEDLESVNELQALGYAGTEDHESPAKPAPEAPAKQQR
jgi:arylsulfatase A-like enzyme